MNIPLPLLLDLCIAVLLIVTIGYALTLNNRLSVLRKDNMGLMRKRANSAKQFSHTLSEKIGSTLEQRIISAGLDSIRGVGADYVKDGASVIDGLLLSLL